MSSSSRINFGQASPTYRAGYMIDGDSDSDDEKVDLTDVPEDLLDMNEEDFENELRKRFESEMHDLQEGYKAEPIPVEAFRDIPEYVNKKYKSDGGGKPDSKDVDDEREPLDTRQADLPGVPKVVEINPQSSQQQQQPQRTRPLFDTDGVLSCPCCMTTLCMDCQRHEKYKQQYRAMFVMNVKVMPEKLQHDPTDPTVYYPVRCEYCSTEVGVVDPDQVYHFFNVIASDPQ
ncbi:hypothetical protein SARC_07300 [Sphaeroforma arctica JP610]|uniref:E2F-associated phosphoprotein n=1 Tax=Sphaeroforma arctica JP610 TaxID=667725 RepID=A0A0L0FU37_9EUKA|nr:hypothetical protein SARC_07300 [Sphaeroforma arctica JP610]KNC80342.1 hypothetical protein SARC_07300 [Sphaeroforma arctica JP610]|eukprot:XP_014154244.1 hypothetical protein SARC_07300 [Sphaeroforma arctica JP610]